MILHKNLITLTLYMASNICTPPSSVVVFFLKRMVKNPEVLGLRLAQVCGTQVAPL